MKNLTFVIVIMSLLQACGNDVNNDLQSQQFPSSVSGSLEHQNNQRVYNLHIPPAYDGLTDLPLVIMLHGGSGNAKSVQGFTQMNPVADANGFMIAYPQGFAPAGQNGFSWADGRETSATLMGIDDVGFILKLVEKLISNYRINSNKVYVAGFSNGGFMSQKLACELEDVFAGVGTLGATIDSDVLSKCTTSQSIPMLLMLGDADPFVPYKGGTVANNPSPIAGIETLANFWKENNNCSTTKPETQLPDVNSRDNSTVSLFQFSDCACDADVSLYRINGGGHTWPGVENVSYEMIAGETNKDINASTVLWEFFDEHERCI